ncbi:unnamed protein product [Sphagnum jensenii]|uniref:cGMP-dependent protein kinase n=1 Tax=Sphagnum jensenii TaxID=128206 RepID=A0ABP1BSL9_9BRYO
MSEVSMGQPLSCVVAAANSTTTHDKAKADLIKYMEQAWTAIAAAKIQVLKTVMMKFDRDMTPDGITVMIKELEELLANFNSQQISIVKMSLNRYAEWIQKPDLSNVEKMTHNVKENSQGVIKVEQLDHVNPNAYGSSISDQATTSVSDIHSELNSASHDWSDTWSEAVGGVIKNRRQRICGRDLSMSESLLPIQVVPKSETTKERLRTILSNHFIFGDLEKELREEIIDAFQDVRVSPGTEVIKQGDVADYFYIIGNEPFLLLRTRGAGESFGDLAMMYDTTRNATVKATSHALLWTVNRITFKSILGRHLSESSNAQVTFLKLVCLEYLTSPEISMLSHSMGVHRMKAGETIYKAGELTDRLYVVHRGTVIMTPNDKKADQIVLVKGSYFGEDSLMSNEPCLSTMVAGQRAELYYLDREVLEANLGPLKELNETRRREDEKRGIVKNITFEELEEIGVLGAGLFGKVKLVYSHHTKEHYALKCVSKAKVVKMQEEEHLRNEKIHMSDLDHPFITKLIRTFKDARNVYLLVELTTGGELFLFMEKMGRLQEWEAAFYAGSVLLALEYMHSKGIVYRDLKPENTMISETGYPKLIDMGFAKRIHNRRTFSMCGTPDYMAPEIIKRQGHGKGVDYWALGCLIFEMITNTSPFNKGNDPPQVVFRTITQGNVRFPPYMSANAIDIVKQLLDPNPETRLGCRKSGTAEIKEHPFFDKVINFQLLIREKEEAPMVPPKVSDYRKLCVIVDSGDPHDLAVNTAGNKTDWDDIF